MNFAEAAMGDICGDMLGDDGACFSNSSSTTSSSESAPGTGLICLTFMDCLRPVVDLDWRRVDDALRDARRMTLGFLAVVGEVGSDL